MSVRTVGQVCAMEWCNVLFWEMEFAMKMSMLSVLVLGLCISFCGFADAQSVTEKSTQKSPVQSKIALCDVEHLLNNYAPFQKTLRETDEEWARHRRVSRLIARRLRNLKLPCSSTRRHRANICI